MRGPCLGRSHWGRRGRWHPSCIVSQGSGGSAPCPLLRWLCLTPPAEDTLPRTPQGSDHPHCPCVRTKRQDCQAFVEVQEGGGPIDGRRPSRDILRSFLETVPWSSVWCLGEASPVSPTLSALLPPGDLWGRVGVGYTRGLGGPGGVIVLPLSQPLPRMPPVPPPWPTRHQQVEEAGGTGARPSDPLSALKGVGSGLLQGQGHGEEPWGPPPWSLSRGQICRSPPEPGMDGWG